MSIQRFFARLTRLARAPRTPQAPGKSPPSRWYHAAWGSNSYLLTPLVSILLFFVVMSLVLWSLNRREQQQQEDTLYRNVAWAQQQIRLATIGAQEQLQALARDLATGHNNDAQSFQTAMTGIMQEHPEILYTNWYTAAAQPRWPAPAASSVSVSASALASISGAAGTAASATAPAASAARSAGASRASAPARRAALPGRSAPPPASSAPNAVAPLPAHPDGAQIAAAATTGFATARASRRQEYSPLIRGNTGDGYIVLQTPVYQEREFLGTLAAVFSVRGILKHDIPPELSTKYRISILDAENRELVTSSTRPRLPRDVFDDLPLAPPGGIAVRVYAYPQTTNFTNNTLVWLVVGLSCFVLWSLWNLWKHTRRRFAAQQALYAEMFFRRAMENSVQVGLRVLDMQGRITHVNPAFCRMTGWDESELVNRIAPFPYWPQDAWPEMQRHFDMTLRGKMPPSGSELKVQRKDGSFFHARLYVSPLIDSAGRQTGWMSSMTDITEPRRVREELVAAHERFTTVLESLDVAVSVLAVGKSELLFANRYYRHLFGIRPDGHLELAGDGFDSTLASSDSIDTVDTYAGLPASVVLAESEAQAQEVYVERIQKWFEVRRQYIQWVDGHLAQMQIATDITTRKQAQELARQQDEKLQFTSRLMTMGEMASSLAHELNQPLTAINNYCSGTAALVRAGRASPDTLLQSLEKTAQQAVRAGMIIKRIREFVKRSEPKRQAARVADIVADAIGLAEIETRKRRIRIVTDMRARLPVIYVDPVLIEQVLVNLLKNAAEAMAQARPNAPDPVIHIVMTREGENVRISVTDQGPGVDEATAERLFEPFYSTKSDGMGMGLNICRSIVESHRGRLWVVNDVDAHGQITGATFHCSLPVGAYDMAHDAARAAQSTPSSPSSETATAETDDVLPHLTATEEEP